MAIKDPNNQPKEKLLHFTFFNEIFDLKLWNESILQFFQIYSHRLLVENYFIYLKNLFLCICKKIIIIIKILFLFNLHS
jgi:hypothetical protein